MKHVFKVTWQNLTEVVEKSVLKVRIYSKSSHLLFLYVLNLHFQNAFDFLSLFIYFFIVWMAIKVSLHLCIIFLKIIYTHADCIALI